MMRRGSMSALTITQRAGDGQSEARGKRRREGKKEGAGMERREGALQHSQHCQCEAMRLNYKCFGFSGIH